jgi:hypothetical protein
MLMTQPAEIPEMGEQRGQLISREVNNAVNAAFNALAQTAGLSLVSFPPLVDRSLINEMLESDFSLVC